MVENKLKQIFETRSNFYFEKLNFQYFLSNKTWNRTINLFTVIGKNADLTQILRFTCNDGCQ